MRRRRFNHTTLPRNFVPKAELLDNSGLPLAATEERGKAGKENRLTFQDLVPALGNVKPCGAVELGKRLSSPRPWRPFHFELIAPEVLGIPIVLDGPDMDKFASGLLGLAKRNCLAVRPVTGLFRKFALCRCEGRFAICDQSLRN